MLVAFFWYLFKYKNVGTQSKKPSNKKRMLVNDAVQYDNVNLFVEGR